MSSRKESRKKKASVRKETDAVSGMRVSIERKNPEPKAATPSEQSMSRGRSVSQKRSIQGKSNHGGILRQPCRYYMKGTCTRSLWEYWHLPECQLCKTETGCKAGDRCLFRIIKLMNDQTKNTRRLHFHKRRKRRQECCGYCENYITIGLRLARFGCRRNPIQKVLRPIQRIRFTQSTLRHASIREKKGPSLGKIKVKNPHQRSP